MTPKMQAFVDGKVAGLSNKDAAIAAGYAAGSASERAITLLKNPAVCEAIEAAGGIPKNEILKPHYASSLELMRDLYNNRNAPLGVRLEAAKLALPYEHGRIGETGKKQAKTDAAKELSTGAGRFKKKAPPKLKIVRG